MVDAILYCFQLFIVFEVIFLAFGLGDNCRMEDQESSVKNYSKQETFVETLLPCWWKIPLIIVFFAWLVSGFLIWFVFSPQNRGVVGDMFGAVNALFSGLAFAGLILTMWMQRQELTLQRNELELTREEMALARKEAEGQKKALEKQADFLGKQTTAMEEQIKLLRQQADAMKKSSEVQTLNHLYEACSKNLDETKNALIIGIENHRIERRKICENEEYFDRNEGEFLLKDIANLKRENYQNIGRGSWLTDFFVKIDELHKLCDEKKSLYQALRQIYEENTPK